MKEENLRKIKFVTILNNNNKFLDINFCIFPLHLIFMFFFPLSDLNLDFSAFLSFFILNRRQCAILNSQDCNSTPLSHHSTS